MSNEPFLQQYGKNLLASQNIQLSRTIFDFDVQSLSQVDITNSPEKAVEFLAISVLNIPTTAIKDFNIVARTFMPETKADLKWHIDDCNVVKLSSPPTYNCHLYNKIGVNRYLFCVNKWQKPPTYTAVFYHSTQNFDFQGGELVFTDDAKISPQSGKGVIFDAREPHCVLPVKSGMRISTVVKLLGISTN